MPPIRRIELPAAGPEDVTFDAEGRVLTGTADGRIFRLDPAADTIEELANTGGRPLGMKVRPDGSLLVCDSVRGLLTVNPETGSADVLVGEVDGVPLNFASNVVVARDGTVYFSASTRHYPIEEWKASIVEHEASGRLFRLTTDGQLATLLDNVQFANGIALSADESFILVVESGAYRLTRVWLTGPRAGESEVFVDNLPGGPDNMALGSDGLFWVSLCAPRNAVLDKLLPLPGVIRKILWMLPDWTQPKPARTVWIVGLDNDGNIVRDLQQPGESYSMVTSVCERDGVFYLGSLEESAVATFSVK